MTRRCLAASCFKNQNATFSEKSFGILNNRSKRHQHGNGWLKEGSQSKGSPADKHRRAAACERNSLDERSFQNPQATNSNDVPWPSGFGASAETMKRFAQFDLSTEVAEPTILIIGRHGEFVWTDQQATNAYVIRPQLSTMV